MLHISKKEQAERLQERLDDPQKHWKFNPGDLEDRDHWNEFQAAYETLLHRCSTQWAPWHVVPADRKWVRNAVIARIVKATLEAMDPRYPQGIWKPGEFKIRRDPAGSGGQPVDIARDRPETGAPATG